jgi:nucleotide-binding universal stress UspA family protein
MSVNEIRYWEASMPFTNLFIAQTFGGGLVEHSALRYVKEMAAQEKGHLTAALGALFIDLSVIEVLPLARAAVDVANDERLEAASNESRSIENLGSTEGFSVETHVIQQPQEPLIKYFASLARLSDLCVLSRPSDNGVQRRMVEGILFGSGRPVLLVPPGFKDWAGFRNVAIAWDGSARADRAVGDAMPIISSAASVEVVCVSEDLKHDVPGADLAAQLSRRCERVDVIDLPPLGGDIGKAIQNHVELTRADLLIMGAYAHARLWQLVMGGVTSSVMAGAMVPVFMSY